MFSLLLSACGDGLSDKQLQKVTLQAASTASEASVAAPDMMQPQTLTASAPEPLPAEGMGEQASSKPKPGHEFNPADFPDSCNDYIDSVAQCIDVMDKSGLEGTASLQMQLDEMQASWLKETDKNSLNATCSNALMDIEPALRDLGC